jgi:hypothetical protein
VQLSGQAVTLFGCRRILCALVEPGVLDCQRRSLRQRRKQAPLLLAKGTGLLEAQVEDAEDVAVELQRQVDEGTYTLGIGYAACNACVLRHVAHCGRLSADCHLAHDPFPRAEAHLGQGFFPEAAGGSHL